MMRFSLQVAVWLVWAGAASADMIEFKSPTGNIQCAIYSDPSGASVRCDMSSLVPSYTERPAGCEFDWGSSFAVDAKGKGYLACVSDPAAGPGAVVLRYGQAASLGGISCVSAETGMTCTNAKGHGFSIAKARQKLY